MDDFFAKTFEPPENGLGGLRHKIAQAKRDNTLEVRALAAVVFVLSAGLAGLHFYTARAGDFDAKTLDIRMGRAPASEMSVADAHIVSIKKTSNVQFYWVIR